MFLGEKIVQYQPDGAGKTVGMGLAGTDYQFAYQYDALGRLEQILNVQNTPGGVTQSLWFQYSYDAASNETQRYSAINGMAQLYPRDEQGRMGSRTVKKVAEPQYAQEAVSDSAPGLPSIPLLPRIPGLLTGLTNLLDNASAADVPPVGTDVSSEIYTYDLMSRLDRTDRSESTYPAGPAHTDRFGYDQSGQLTSASHGWNGRHVSYTVDDVGNRSQVNDNGYLGGYSPNGSYRNQYVSAPGGGVNNGPEHEIAAYEGKSYTYYGDQRLASVRGGGSTYRLYYDGLGRCIHRIYDGPGADDDFDLYYVYDGDQPIYEYKADGTRAGWNVYGQGIDEILLRADYVVEPLGQGYFFQQDRLGSVTHLTGFQGEVIEAYRYDAFGQATTRYMGGVFNNRFKFTGREAAPEPLGIYEYRNRAYHPGLGRFLSEDPLGFAAGDTNLFRYCGGDPVNYVDPFGLNEFPVALPPPPYTPAGPEVIIPTTDYGGRAGAPSRQNSPDDIGRRGSERPKPVNPGESTGKRPTDAWGNSPNSPGNGTVGGPDRIVAGGNATEPFGSPSHYTNERLVGPSGGRAAGLTTPTLGANNNGTVTLYVHVRVLESLKGTDALAVEWDHPRDWEKWRKTMNAIVVDKFRGAPWDLNTGEKIRVFLDPPRSYDPFDDRINYFQRELYEQRYQRYDFEPNGPHVQAARRLLGGK